MPNKFHYALAYPSFDRLISRMERWLLINTDSILGYNREQIAKRLTQRVVEIGLVPYIHKYVKDYSSRKTSTSVITPLEFGGLHFSTQSDKVEISSYLLIKAVFEFHIHWAHVLFYVLLALFVRKSYPSSATLLFGVGVESLFVSGDDTRFANYCKRGPIEALQSAKQLIVQFGAVRQSATPDSIQYSRFPLFALLLRNADARFLFKLMIEHGKVFFVFWFSILKQPIISIIGRDLAYHPLTDSLNRRHLIESIVVTNSNYSAQPLWMSSLPNRCYQTHMVWYAQNTVPIVYQDAPAQLTVPNYRHLMVDTSWVWTSGYGEYLRSLNPTSDVKVVGPIVWQMPEFTNDHSDNELIVTIFDVTPVNDSFANELGLYGNYYSADNMIKFIDQVMLVMNKIRPNIEANIRVMLKHKRGHHSRHSHEYISHVNNYIESSQITVVPFNENIYKVVAQSAMVIVVPYSSPAYIADTLSIPAIFFDPTESVFPAYEQSTNLRFISSDIELERVSLDILTAQIKSISLERH